MLNVEEIYNGLRHDLRRFILKRVKNDATADDLLHDVFVKIHAGIDDLHDATRLQAWVFRVAANAVNDHYRRQRPGGSAPEIGVAPVDLSEGAAQRLAPTLTRMIAEMPEEYREALLMTEVEGMSQVALADRLGLSVSGAKSRVQRARGWLRERLLDCCHFEFDRRGQVIDFRPNSCTRCCP